MSNQQVFVDKWLDLLKQSNFIKLSDVFFGSKKSSERLAAATSTQSQITSDTSSLSNADKSSIRKYLDEKNNQIDSNILSGLSKLGSSKEIPSFVYIVIGTIVGYCLMEVLHLPFIITALATFALLSLFMYLILENSKNRYYCNYLLKLLD